MHVNIFISLISTEKEKWSRHGIIEKKVMRKVGCGQY